MLEFRTLGTIDLRGEDGRRIEYVLQHSKRLCLLAYLCASHPIRLHRRDTLIALFWPELDDAHAHGALRQEVYRLRHALGSRVITGEEAIGIDNRELWCDVTAFYSALNCDEPTVALDLWKGEFLPGAHIDGGEFERWLDETRDVLRRRATDAAQVVLESAASAGDLRAAVAWARRLIELAPYDEKGWQRLIMLLDASGDRAGALAAYEQLSARLRQDLEVDASPETTSLVEKIRARVTTFPTASARSAAQLSIPPAAAATEAYDEPVPRTRSSNGRRRRWIIVSGVLAVTAFAAVVPMRMRVDDARPQYAVIDLLPTENRTGDATLDVLAARLTDRLAQGIAEPHFVELVIGDAKTDIDAVVSSALYRRGDLVEVRTRIAEPGEGGKIIRVPAPVIFRRNPRDASLDSLVARVVVALAARYDPLAAVPGQPAPFRMPSWEAYLEYLRGSELFGEFQYEPAAQHLLRAYQVDGTFVKAAQFAAISLLFAGHFAAADSLLNSAMQANEPLPDYERYFGQWIRALLHGRRADAYRAARETNRVTHHPVLVWVAATEAVRLNRPREAIRLIEAVPDWGVGWWRNYRTNIWETYGGAYHVRGQHKKELAAVLPLQALFPESFGVIRAEIRARAGLHEPAEVLRLVNQALTLPPAMIAGTPSVRTTPADLAWIAAQELDAHNEHGAAARARQLGLDWLRTQGDTTRADRLIEARLCLESGDIRDASRIIAEFAPYNDLQSLGLAGLIAAAHGDTAFARNVIRSLEALESPYLSGAHLLAAAGVRAALHEPDAAMETLRRAIAEGLAFGVELHALPMLNSLAGRRDFLALLRPRG